MNASDVRGRVRRNRSAWLAVGFVLLSSLLSTAVVARPGSALAAIERPEQATGPVAFAVTQPVPAIPPAEATQKAVTVPASLPASQPASQPTSQPTTVPSTQPRDPDLTPEMIDSHKKQVQAAQDILDAERDSILKMYDRALDQLKQADYWQGQAAKADEAIKQVPDLLDKVNVKLKQPVEDLTPRVPDGATLQQIDQRCKEAEELDRAARGEAGSLNREQQSRQDRKTEIQNRRNAIRQGLAGLAEQLSNLQAASSAADQAQRFLLRATRRALYREYNALEKQGNSDDARQELLTVQIDLANRYQDATGRALAQWKAILKERRAAEAVKVAAQASQQSVTFKDRPELFDIAEANKELATRRIQLQALAEDIQQTMESREAIAAQRRSVTENSQNMMKRIDTVGLTEAVSSLLRRHRAQLPDILQHERNIRRLETEIARIQIELIDIEDQRAALVDIDRRAEQVLRGLKVTVAPQDQESLRGQVQDLLRTKRKYLDDLIRDYGAYAKTWFELEEEERFLIGETRKYADYIDEHILWVRSSKPLQPGHVRHTWRAIGWFANPAGWAEASQALLTDLQTNPLTVLAGLLLFGALTGLRRRFRLRLGQIGEMASKGYTYAFSQTLQAMGLTLLLAVSWPGLVWFVGWRLSAAVTTGEFPAALAAGLTSVSTLFLVLELARQICRKKGLGQTHFHWPAEAMLVLRKNLSWLMLVVLPLTFVHATVDWQANAELRDSLGRLAFIGSMIAMAVFARRVLRPGGPLLGSFLQQRRDGWLDRLRYVWYPMAVAIPIVMALAAARGYYYTAMQLSSRILATVVLIFATFLAHALLLRLLFVARRRLAIEAAQKRRAAQAHGKETSAPSDGPPTVQDAETTASAAAMEPEVNLATVDTQTRRLVRVAIFFGLAVGLYITWVDMLPALGILDRVPLWSTTVDVSQLITNDDGTKSLRTMQRLVPITLSNVAMAGLIMLVAIAAARNIPGLLEVTVLRLMPMEPGSRYAVNAISRYIITIFGLILAFGAIGIGWSKVQWLAAAVTVGLGFGLQEIFANFISGIIILFERPVRVGDVITVGEISGTVSKIRIRATTIVDWNRKELIVPNKQFITSQMVNWTLSDRILRLVISVGVPHGSDPNLVRSLLLQVARGNPRVLDNPKPSTFLLGFSKESMDFSLRVFVASPDMILGVQDELHAAIGEALRRADIEAAFSRSPG